MAYAPDPYLTATGTALTVENAGFIISRYLQSFGKDPASCRHTVTHTTVPAPDPPLSDPAPTGLCFEATVQLPPIAKSATYSTKEPYPSKLLAKRVACWEACKDLLAKGELDDDLLPRPNGGKPMEKKARIRIRESRDPASLSRWVAEGDRALGEGDEDVERGLTLSARWEVFKDAMRGRMPAPSPGEGAGPSGVGVYKILIPEDLNEVVGRRAWMTTIQILGERPMALLTAKKVIDGEEDLILKGEVTTRMVDIGELKKLSEEQFEYACRYTEQSIRAHMNKDLHLPATGPHWLVLPLIRSYVPGKVAKRTDIDWAEIEFTLSLAPTSAPFTFHNPATLEQELVDAIATNPQEYGRKFYITSTTKLNPLSPHPADPSQSVLDCYFPRSAPLPLTAPEQVVFTAVIANSGRSGGILNPSISSDPLYLIPEFTQRYCYPASTFRSLSTMPSFFLVLDDLLAAKELNAKIFDSTLTPALTLQALTPPMSAPGQPNRSYERLEILGDTLIKLLTTLDTCLGGPLSDNSRVDRHIMLSNKSLRMNGVEAGIAPYIRCRGETTAKAWLPDGWILGDQQVEGVSSAKRMFKIGDKVVADVVESLVGASYLSSDRSLDAAISAMIRLKIPLKHLTSWSSVSTFFQKWNNSELAIAPPVPRVESAPTAPTMTAAPISPPPKSNAKAMNWTADAATSINLTTAPAAKTTAPAAKTTTPAASATPTPPYTLASWMQAFTKTVPVAVLGYTFRDTEKSKIVFNASSYTRGRQEFQQYKIMGDSLMDYFVVEKLHDHEAVYGPAVITHMKHSRCSDQSLAAMAVCLGLADRMVEVDKPVQAFIQKYKTTVEARWKEAENILKKSSRTDEEMAKVTEFWSGTTNAPTLGALPQVLLGAIVADQDGDMTAAKKLVYEQFWPFMEKFAVGPINHSLHPKSVMSEMMGRYGCTVWKIVRLADQPRGVVCAVLLHGQEIGRGTAETQVLATRNACENVIATLTEQTVKDHCQCWSQQGATTQDVPLPPGQKHVSGFTEESRKA